MKSFKNKDIFNICMSKKRVDVILTFALVLFLVIVLSSYVKAASACNIPIWRTSGGFETVELPCQTLDEQFKGDQPQQPGLPAVGQGTINAFNGNLVLSETDYTSSGRGLGLSVTRTYNSNVYERNSFSLNSGILYSLFKPGVLGYGWDWNMGRIRTRDNPNLMCGGTVNEKNQKVISTENIVQFPDGSVSRFIKDVDDKYPTDYVLDNFALVNMYHGDFSSAYPTVYYEIVQDGAKYIFNHYVGYINGCNRIDPITNEPQPWTDAGDIIEQRRYNGVYLTRIEDAWGNYVDIEYYEQTWRNPNDASARTYWYNDAKHLVSYGSPFIKNTTSNLIVNFPLVNVNSSVT